MRGLAVAVALLASALVSAELRINGVGDEISGNVQAFVALGGEPCDAEEWRIQRRFRSVESEARKALEYYGFYEPQIASKLETDDSCWTATIDISPGLPVTLRNVDVVVVGAALEDPGFRVSVPENLSSGTRLNHGSYESLKRALQVQARDRGYVDARFVESRLDIWPEKKAADVALRFDSGDRYRIGEVRIQETEFDPEFVKRYIPLVQGQPYDSDELALVHRDLSDSGYFRRVQVLPDFDAASDGAIPVNVSLAPLERIEYTIGAGYATDTGPRFRAGYRNRRIKDRGHRFNASLSASPVLSGIVGEYRKPLTDPRSEWLSYTGAFDREDTESFESNITRLGVRRSKRLSTSWLRTLSLDFSYEDFTVADTESDSRLVMPAIAFDHKSGDRDIYPSAGRRFGAEIRGAHTVIGSSTSFLQLIGRVRFIHSLGENTRLLSRATIGWTRNAEFEELPPSVRFFAGGDESIRGFGYESLGPTDDEGQVVGGDRLLVASVELERRLRGNFYGAAFVDAGNAFDGSDVDPAVGVGLGIKWRSPIGGIRLYLAHPLNKSDQDVRVHISLGPEL